MAKISDIDNIDKSLRVETKLKKTDIRFFDVREEPFCVYGLYDYRKEPEFKRMPDDVAASVNGGVATLHKNTAGGRVRFCTDSQYVAIKAEWDGPAEDHVDMTRVCSCGFDMYIDSESYPTSKFYNSFIPPYFCDGGYESVLDFPDRRMRYITVNFPAYNNVRNLYIGLQSGAVLGEGKKYRTQKPVVFYGSSITQGCAASRPGNTYQAILSRRLDMNYIDLGFSGSAYGEDNISKYMAELDMSAFVCDFDHNAQNDRLAANHRAVYVNIRRKHKDIPYIIVSRADVDSRDGYEDAAERRAIILETYNYARRNGDRNVYFIDGESIYSRGSFADCYTVDGVHPTDSGFVEMAKAFEATFLRIINDKKM